MMVGVELLFDGLAKAGVFAFAWLTVFLLHELMHIKSQGVLAGGSIRVNGFGMTCSGDNVKYKGWFSLAGGFLAGILSLVFSLLVSDPWVRFSFATVGFVNLAYGFFEWKYIRVLSSHDYFIGRYSIYGAIIAICLLLWVFVW